MLRSLTISSGLLCLLLNSCVSSSKFNRLNNDYQTTKTQLDSTRKKSEMLGFRVDLLSDSLQRLEKTFRDERIVSEYQNYKNALAATDREMAAQSLARLVQLDSSQSFWVYDSLAWYHYMYFNTPGAPRSNNAALYYTQRGLQIKPENQSLIDIKAKLLLENQQDSIAYDLFRYLWSKYNDYTYLWDMCYIDLFARSNVKLVEAVISEVTADKSSLTKNVRLDDLELKRVDIIPAKAAFLYLRAMIQSSQGQSSKAKKTLEEVIKLAPSYINAQRAYYQLTNPQYR